MTITLSNPKLQLDEPVPIDDPLALFQDEIKPASADLQLVRPQSEISYLPLDASEIKSHLKDTLMTLGEGRLAVKAMLHADCSSATLVQDYPEVNDASSQNVPTQNAQVEDKKLEMIIHETECSAITVSENSDASFSGKTEFESQIVFHDGLSLLVECAVAEIEHRSPQMGVLLPPLPAVDVGSPPALSDSGSYHRRASERAMHRHGISRYAPYGTRFGALMRDGSYKTSHIAGDLSNRARLRGGRGARVDLTLVQHNGETEQLEKAWAFCEQTIAQNKPRPGPSEVLNFLREANIDFDYRKGGEVRLLQRNASNFYKRMMEYGKRASPSHAKPERRSSLMDLYLSVFADEAFQQKNTTPNDPTPHVVSPVEDVEMDDAKQKEELSEDADYEMDEDADVDDETDQTFAPVRRVSGSEGGNASRASRQIKLGLCNKGLSRHSPYGTRFSAQMDDGSVKESFLAGDLVDRVKIGRHRCELRLVLHQGEIEQLETAWQFIRSSSIVPGAASVLDHLRSMGMDINHRKHGCKLLQKNAGNFFKRVQEFGKRRSVDPNYLKQV